MSSAVTQLITGLRYDDQMGDSAILLGMIQGLRPTFAPGMSRTLPALVSLGNANYQQAMQQGNHCNQHGNT